MFQKTMLDTIDPVANHPFILSQRQPVKKKLRIAAVITVVVAVPFAAVAAWLANRPSDVPPQLHEGAGPISFNPKFGPKTPEEVDKYLQNRTARSGRTRIGNERYSAEAVDTLNRRWGLKPGMTQEEIDRVREDQEKVWAYIENTRTTRYKIRSWLRMNQ